MRDTYGILARKPEEKSHFAVLDICERLILK
jgi:hypothetical protein